MLFLIKLSVVELLKILVTIIRLISQFITTLLIHLIYLFPSEMEVSLKLMEKISLFKNTKTCLILVSPNSS
jgi:hypothetical protein